MSDRPRKIAVVCGQLRNAAEFSMVLELLLRQQQLGNVDGIILSTWKADLDENRDIIGRIEKLGIDIVAGEPVSDRGKGNINLQRQTLFQALSYIDEKDTVIKLRTDKAANLVDKVVPNAPDYLNPSNGPLDYRVGVSRASLFIPFMIADFAFYANARDARRMCTTDNPFLYIGDDDQFKAEMHWFYTPISKQNAFFETYYSRFKPQLVSQTLTNLETPVAPYRYVKDFFSHYWSVLAENYEIFRDSSGEFELDLDDILTTDRVGLRRFFHTISVTDDAFLQKVRSNPVSLPADYFSSSEVLSQFESLFPTALKKKTTPVRYSAQPTNNGTMETEGVAWKLYNLIAADESASGNDEENKKAFQVLSKYAERVNFAKALHNVAEHFNQGTGGLPQSDLLAREYYLKAAQMREAESVEQMLDTYETTLDAVKDAQFMKFFHMLGLRRPAFYVKIIDAWLDLAADPNAVLPETGPKVSGMQNGLQACVQMRIAGAEEVFKKFKTVYQKDRI